MPNLNEANRQVCDVDIREGKTKKPFLFFDTANATTTGISGDSVHAMKKGSRAITFHNPVDGTLSIEAQITPFKIYSLFSAGIIETSATFAVKDNIICKERKKLTIVSAENITDEHNNNLNDERGYDLIKEVNTYPTGTIFVYPDGEFGTTPIQGSFDAGIFTALNDGEIIVGRKYDVAYLISKSDGIKKISFNNKITIPDYYITMLTLDKDEYDNLTPFLMTAYKAQIQRNLELSFSSEGDPLSITITFDLLHDMNGNVLDIVEDES